MKVLLDENLPHELRRHLFPHLGFTVHYMGWSGTKNGALLAKAAAEQFDVMLIMDSGVPYQQNRAMRPISVVVLSAASNDLSDLLPLIPRILESLSIIQPQSLLQIGINQNPD
ncbi:MAG TPA: hypothetical protein VGG19_19185 [Tepidisphaeraceae bacterium]|jgi:hypothetical protein